MKIIHSKQHISIPIKLLLDEKLSIQSKYLYIYLIYKANQTSSVRDISRDLNTTTPSLIRWFEELKITKWIKTIGQGSALTIMLAEQPVDEGILIPGAMFQPEPPGEIPPKQENLEHRTLALLLKTSILQNKPDVKITDAQINSWAREARLILTVDKRNKETLEKVIVFCQKHHFWWKNIFSMSKLRKQFDRLEAEMNEKGTETTGSNLLDRFLYEKDKNL